MKKAGNVLVVDDHADFAMLLSAALSEFCHVHTAHGVQSALSMMKRFSFDIAVLDVNLEDGDGFEIAKFANERSSEGPTIILISGLNKPMDRQRAWLSHAEDFVTKPINLPEFTKKIQNKMDNIISLKNRYSGLPVRSENSANLSLIVSDQQDLDAKELEFLNKLLEHFVSHGSDPGLNLDSTARAMGYSRRSFQRLLARSTRSSFSTVLRRFKTRTAESLLHENYSIKEIARLCGFRSASYLSTKFKEEFGISPRERRRQLTAQSYSVADKKTD